MAEIISVRFRSEGKQYYFDPQGMVCRPGDGLIVETASGLEYAQCVRGNFTLAEAELAAPLRPVVRAATEEDLAVVEKNREKEVYAFRVCQEKILEHKLDMKLVSVECSFEGTKILFFFTSDGRVDFRGLVKSLAAVFHTRIELRQIGIRDEAKMLGGLGICGRPFCCNSFLREFQPVSIKMAKTQNLSLNPTKISGTCGRLMCCLKYEQEAYEDAVKRCPKQESFVETPDGVGTVSGVNLLREQVKVRLEDSQEPPKCYRNCEVCVVRSGKGKRPEGYVAPPPEELAKLRYVDPEEEAKPWAATERSSLAAALEAVFSASDAPAEPDHGEPPRPEKQGEGKGHSRSRRRRKPAGEGGAQAPAQPQAGQPRSQEQPPRPNKPRPPKGPQDEQGDKPQPQPGKEGEEKRPSSRPRRRRHRSGGGPKPPAAPTGD